MPAAGAGGELPYFVRRVALNMPKYDAASFVAAGCWALYPKEGKEPEMGNKCQHLLGTCSRSQVLRGWGIGRRGVLPVPRICGTQGGGAKRLIHAAPRAQKKERARRARLRG